MPSLPRAYVVIPAHNEGGTIRRSLHRLLDGAMPGEIEVIVVANACTDDTARVAEAEGVRTVTTEVPGKPNALRLGDDTGMVAGPGDGHRRLRSGTDQRAAPLRAISARRSGT